MRLRLGGSIALVALAVAAMVGPFGAAAAAPYVYSCTPGTPIAGGTQTPLYLYNGQASTATVTIRALTPDGTNITAGVGLPNPVTVNPTTTKVLVYTPPPGNMSSFTFNPINSGTVVGSIRLVSDVALGVGVNLSSGGDHPMNCPLIVV